MQELHYFDRKDIEQQALISEFNGKEKEITQNELIGLSRQKKSLYAKVYESECRLSNALDKLDTANGFKLFEASMMDVFYSIHTLNL